MTIAVVYKLLAIFLTVGLGWVAGHFRWLGQSADADDPGSDPARVLSNAVFYIFVPALLFRTIVRLDLSTLPGRTVAAYFLPAIAYLLAVYFWQRHAITQWGAAAPATRATTAVYGNAVQLGIPMAAALFGEAGLALHVGLVSLHGVILLTLLTVLVELDLARVNQAATMASTLRATVRNTIVHPVVLPVLAGLAWNATGLGLHPVVDEALASLGAAAAAVCLVLLGISLAYYGVQGHVRGALVLSLLKLLVLPAMVLVVAHWGFGLSGMPLNVLVMMAALPVGSNAVIFGQRYDTLKAEATAAILLSSLGFVATAALWLGVLAWLQ